MKSNGAFSRLREVVCLLMFGLSTTIVSAQGEMPALNVSPVLGAPPGYVSQGVGWSFVPTVDIMVTAINGTAPEVDFWLGTSQNIGTYNYDGPYQNGRFVFGSGAPTNYQSITPLFLYAGQTYYISTQQTNFTSTVNVFFYSLDPANSPNLFNPSPYISQYGSYYLSSDGQWTSTTGPASGNGSVAILGPNFLFQVVPEPSIVTLIISGLGLCAFLRRK